MKTLSITALHREDQRGFILVLSLFFLLLTTVVGLFLFRSSTLELRMAGNAGAKAIAFENAEQAHMGVEDVLNDLADNISVGNAYDCNAQGVGFYAVAGQGLNCVELDQDVLDWDNGDSVEDAGNAYARHVLEYHGVDEVYEIGDDVEMGTEPNKFEVHVFRVVGRGDESSGAQSTIGTIFLARGS